MIKYHVYLEIRDIDLAESIDIMMATAEQYMEDRTFKMYVIDRLFSGESYIDYKKKLYKPQKEIDVAKVMKDTNKALELFSKNHVKEE